VADVVSSSFWEDRRVLITGHTGFKGGWLALWLADLGARVTGFSLPAPTDPSLFELAQVASGINHIEGDVRDLAALDAAIRDARPEIVFHLAAQPLVRPSYDRPVETYATNVMGTVHLLDSLRRTDGVKAAIFVTSDKCYENREGPSPYRESDPMGGHDPYSSSKGCAELAISAFRRSYFDAGRRIAIASVRAGNVIGGGDWAKDRLIPDIVRAVERGERPRIRSPHAVRPWQHVLEALGGYILLAERLFDGDFSLASGWNFGPSEDDTRPASSIVDGLTALWGRLGAWDNMDGDHPHEAGVLRLDCSRARSILGWRPALTLDQALARVAEWHQAVASGKSARDVTLAQIRDYRVLADAARAAG
jgi:CDP-glucose 4,6-dehydratase